MKNHNTQRQLLLCLSILLLSTLVSVAQTDTKPSPPTTKINMIGYGKAQILDTYLSPLTYNGTAINYINTTQHEMRNGKCFSLIEHDIEANFVKNTTETINEIAAIYHLQLGWYYRWKLLNQHLHISIGGVTQAHIGALYNIRNGNNPIQAKIGINIAPSAQCAYHFNIYHLPMQVGYQITIPSLGCAFTPNYGQSYYEIFSRGNYDHNILITHWVNAPSMRHLFTVDLTLCNTTWRLGYLGNYQQTQLNHIKSHIYTNALLIGVVKKFTLTHIRP